MAEEEPLPSEAELEKLKAETDQQIAIEYAQLDAARKAALARLKNAIQGKTTETPSTLLYSLIEQPVMLPVPDSIPWFLRSRFNVTSKRAIGELLGSFPQAFVLFATPEGKKWVRDNLDDFLDYLATCAMSNLKD